MIERERAILVGIYLSYISPLKTEYSLQELERLADTAQADVQLIFTQQRTHIDSAWYIGKGKVEELKNLVEELEIELVIFNGELSSSQIRNIEHVVQCKVIDRTQLILDIFAMRAKSREGKIQVELAQLQYLLPRLTGRGLSLSRLGGGIGTRGPGETKLETDRRHIHKRINDLKQSLKEIERHRELYRQRRRKNELIQIVLVGYTNAGKSTLLNQLTQSNVLAEDRLFATLDPTSRKVRLPDGKEVIFTDTVGFIQDLPHELVAAFKSTLEEAKEASLILHVIDSSQSFREEQIEVVEELLKEINAHEINRINVYNKADLLKDHFPNLSNEDILISAHTQDDLKRLLTLIEKKLFGIRKKIIFKIPADRGDLLSYIYKYGVIDKKANWLENEEVWEVVADLDDQHFKQELKQYTEEG